MAKRKPSVSPQTTIDVLLERIEKLEAALRIEQQAKMSAVQTIRKRTFLGPSQGMVAINWPTRQLCFYHDNQWICLPFPPTHAIKVFHDKKVNKVENGAFKFSIEHDLDEYDLFDVSAFNGTVGSGTTTVQISNQTRGLDLLSTPITIPGGAYDSDASGTPPVINQGGSLDNPTRRVHKNDRIWIDVDTVGAGSKGLGVYMTFIKAEELPE
jgi:hypothetical protein